jgi:hypothetical protein
VDPDQLGLCYPAPDDDPHSIIPTVDRLLIGGAASATSVSTPTG